MSAELLIPLMRGATNVTMSSDQLADVIIPVPNISLQADVVESELINSTVSVLRTTAEALRDSSTDTNALDLAETVLEGARKCLAVARRRVVIDQFLPGTPANR